MGARCHLGLPVVAVCPPRLEDGTPFPTRYWLSCPLARKRVARLEAAGGVREAQRRVESDPATLEAMRRAHRRYARERDGTLPQDGRPRPSGGVGGVARDGGIKCLHAHLADHWSGHANPVGAWVAERIGPLCCRVPCVVGEGDARPVPNPAWHGE